MAEATKKRGHKKHDKAKRAKNSKDKGARAENEVKPAKPRKKARRRMTAEAKSEGRTRPTAGDHPAARRQSASNVDQRCRLLVRSDLRVELVDLALAARRAGSTADQNRLSFAELVRA